MSNNDSILPELQEARERFLQLVAEIRPDLHRYCARMTGSLADGEDVVQDALAHAYYELSDLRELPALRAWLFRIAHNRALDHLKSYERRMREPLTGPADSADETPEADAALAHEQAVRAAVSRFLELAPVQRSCVVLKDVLEYSLDEIGGMLELSVPAVKAALHRGRSRLRELCLRPEADQDVRRLPPALLRYAALFNARDWDAVRAMLLDDVKLDVVSATRRSGREQVGVYFSNYDRIRDWRLAPAWLDGREVLAVFRHAQDERASYFIELTLRADRVSSIKDFRHVPYIGRDAQFEFGE